MIDQFIRGFTDPLFWRMCGGMCAFFLVFGTIIGGTVLLVNRFYK